MLLCFFPHMQMIFFLKSLYPAPGGVSGIVLSSLIKLVSILCWYHDSIVCLIPAADVWSLPPLGRYESGLLNNLYPYSLRACQVSDCWVQVNSVLLNLPRPPGWKPELGLEWSSCTRPSDFLGIWWGGHLLGLFDSILDMITQEWHNKLHWHRDLPNKTCPTVPFNM